MRVEKPAELARVRWPDRNRGRGRARHPPAAQQSLHIDDQIKPATPERARELPDGEDRSRAAPPMTEPAAIEEDHLIELRMILQQPGTRGCHEPTDFSARPFTANQVQNRQRMNDIADSSWLDDQDSGGRSWKRKG